jgi:hypothetical protein
MAKKRKSAKKKSSAGCINKKTGRLKRGCKYVKGGHGRAIRVKKSK